MQYHLCLVFTKLLKTLRDVVCCNGDMISSSEGILFECHSGPKVITISEDMLFDGLRKTIMDAIKGSRILLDLFYR